MAKKIGRKPKCKECKQDRQVVLAEYKSPSGLVYWTGWECERCNCVVKEIFNAN